MYMLQIGSHDTSLDVLVGAAVRGAQDMDGFIVGALGKCCQCCLRIKMEWNEQSKLGAGPAMQIQHEAHLTNGTMLCLQYCV